MPNKPQRLNQILDLHAPQGANDARWFLIEHQIEQCVMSARTVVGSLTVVRDRPENEEEREIAQDCLSYAQAMLRHILEEKAAFLCYLSATDVAERISGKEL